MLKHAEAVRDMSLYLGHLANQMPPTAFVKRANLGAVAFAIQRGMPLPQALQEVWPDMQPEQAVKAAQFLVKCLAEKRAAARKLAEVGGPVKSLTEPSATGEKPGKFKTAPGGRSSCDTLTC